MTINITIIKNNYITENIMQIINPKGCQITENGVNINHGTLYIDMDGEKQRATHDEAEYAEEVTSDEDFALSPEANARNWAKCHFNEINSIYNSWEALANKVANICSLYEAEKLRHEEGERWRTTFFRNNFYPKESHKQWLKDRNMSHAIFFELINDEEATKDTFSDAKKGYKYIGI